MSDSQEIANLNKYEAKVATFKNPEIFIDVFDKVKDIFEDTYKKGRSIINDIVKLQHDIAEF